MRKRLTAFLLTMLFLASTVSAAWSINDLDEPWSQDYLSNRSDSKQMVELVDSNGNPVNDSELKEKGYDFEFRYNSSNSSGNLDSDVSIVRDMSHLKKGYYYADFKPNFTDGMIEYQLGGTDPEINLTEYIPVGNNTVDIRTDFSKHYKAGKEIEIEASVMDEENDVNEDEAAVQVYFTNGTWTSGLVQLGYNSNKELYTNNVELPYKANSSYIVHVNSTTSGATYGNPFGAESVLLETYPSVEGEIAYLNTTARCNNKSFFRACERGADIDTGLKVTASSAEQVEMDLLAVNRSDSDWVELASKSFVKDGGVWHGSFEVPDLDTSKYTKDMILRYNATNGARMFTVTRNVTYRSYKIRDKSSPTAYQGSDHDVELLFARYFSLEPLNSTRFDNATVRIIEPDGDLMTSFGLEDMEFDSADGLFTRTVNIPSDAQNGTYDLTVTAYNIYGDRLSIGSGFQVKNLTATFSTSGDISLDINKTGTHFANITVKNEVSRSKEVSVTAMGDIENFTTVNNGNNISLSADESKEVPVEFDINRVADYSGELMLNDPGTEFNQTLDVNLDAPSCDLRSGVLCIKNFAGSWVNVSRSERGSTTRNIELSYLGSKAGGNVSISVSGNISDYLTVEPASFDINDTRVITMNYTASVPGTFTGRADIESGGDTLPVYTKLVSTVQSTDTGIAGPSSLDLGYFPSGETLTQDVELENTGQVEITGLSTSSEDYSVSAESVSIPAGETATVEMTFDSVTAKSGTVTVVGSTSVGSTTTSIEVSGNPVPDYSSQADSLSQRITSLSSQAENEALQNRLQSLEADVAEIKTSYEQGNYQEAKRKYETVSSQLNSIERQVSQGSTGGEQSSQDTGGGFPVLLVGLVLFVLLLIGFVAYTSIIPEEGDPLYNVLGR